MGYFCVISKVYPTLLCIKLSYIHFAKKEMIFCRFYCFWPFVVIYFIYSEVNILYRCRKSTAFG